MRLLKLGLASNHSISVHYAILECGEGLHSKFFTIFPRAELGDLGQFLRGSNHGDTEGEEQGQLYGFEKTFPHASGVNIGQTKLAHALLQQCGKLAGALKFLHMGFPVDGKWVRCAHMDLKPNNVIIFGGDGAVGRWKLCDFGISVFKDNVGPQGDGSSTSSAWDCNAQLTMNTKARRGSGQYQAPEIHERWGAFYNVADNTEDTYGRVGRSSDIWSFGCIFAEVLAFALGGPSYVKEFHATRKQKIHGIQYEYFYSPIQSGYLGPSPMPDTGFIVCPQMLHWLDQHCKPDSSSAVWTSCWAGHIKRILQVDPNKRPGAKELERDVLHIWSDALRCRQGPSSECLQFQTLSDNLDKNSPSERFLDVVPRAVLHTDAKTHPSQPVSSFATSTVVDASAGKTTQGF